MGVLLKGGGHKMAGGFSIDKEKIYVRDCLNSAWISSEGKYVKKFENLLENYSNL